MERQASSYQLLWKEELSIQDQVLLNVSPTDEYIYRKMIYINEVKGAT